MTYARSLKLLLKRGALVAAANWPVVIVQFVADTVFNALLMVPIAGGALLVMLLIGAEPAELLRLEYGQIVPALISALLAHPIALIAFLGALGLVASGGSILMFAVKAGSLAVLTAGELAAGHIEQPPLHLSTLTRANAFSIERFTSGLRRLFRRFLLLGGVLAAAYAVAVAAYAFLVFGPTPLEAIDRRIIVTLASVWIVALITVINFLYLLTQIVVAADDCSVGDAVSKVAQLLVRYGRTIAGVLAAILALMVLTTAASVLATAALGLIAFVPFVGLAALPLQLIAWLVRGIVFQYISLAGAAAYLRLHRQASLVDVKDLVLDGGPEVLRS
jgi:hypothetical protein